MHSICIANTQNIHVYVIEIFCIYSLDLFDIHGICMVYVLHIHNVYLKDIQYISQGYDYKKRYGTNPSVVK